MTSLIFSALMYLIARQGAWQRFSKHVRAPRALLDRHFSKTQSSVTVLIPSYSEEPEVVYKTMLSAALQEYPAMRIVLLMDDKPHSTDQDVTARLDETRNLAHKIEMLLDEPSKRFITLQAEVAEFGSKELAATQQQKIIAEYEWAAEWLYGQAEGMTIQDHVDTFFADQVLRALADELALTARALAVSLDENATITRVRARELVNRLAWIFTSKLDVFERKSYASLSHEANKAMNINSYIGLMGSAYKKRKTPDGTILVQTSTPSGDIIIPDSDFILTLDADSVLLRDYCLRLVYFAQEPGNERVAVVQTPYSSFRGAYTRIERLAGATTDLQHILHQGKHFMARLSGSVQTQLSANKHLKILLRKNGSAVLR